MPSSTALELGSFLLAAGIIGWAGVRFVRVAEQLAAQTGLGQALFGSIFLGVSTSLPGLVASVSAAAGGHADLAFSNALGGIAAQTTFLAIADITYRKANLEHAAASVPNMMQGGVLIILLMGVLLFMSGPNVSFAAVHPGSILLPLGYYLGYRIIRAARKDDPWRARQTPETFNESRSAAGSRPRMSLLRAWIRFGLLALLLVATGYTVTWSGLALSARFGISETVVGGLFTAVTTSLPELVTALAAVRIGALTLAVADIVGGNTFDVLFVSISDIAYREGSLYHALESRHMFMIGLASLLTAVLLLGLLRREKRGIANIGFESVLILVLYLVGIVTIVS